jgi:DNA gyrase/topoisomerase IV subunit A
MGTKRDIYKIRKEIDKANAKHNNELLYGFFGRQAESISEVQQRLNQQLRAHEINKMTAEIAELNATTN